MAGKMTLNPDFREFIQSLNDNGVRYQIIQLGFPPNRIDLITTLEGVSFPECYGARIVTTIEDVSVNFIDLDNLRRNKRASGRFQDLADLENLQ